MDKDDVCQLHKDSLMSKTIKLGQINFINCLPVNLVIARSETMKQSQWGIASPPTEARNDDYQIQITEGYPAQLNQLLRDGEIDLAPLSSFEYLSNPDKYTILDGISISSKVQADSVLLFAKDIDSISRSKEIYLTNKSASSVNLLKIILQERFKIDISTINFKVFERDSADYAVKLLIGDEALKEAMLQNYSYVLDLGTAWYELTDLPMVFALWCFNKNSPALAYYDEIQNLILQARDIGLNDLLPDVIVEAYRQTGLPKTKLKEYFSNLDYNFTERHKESLNLFTSFIQKIVNQGSLSH